MRSSTKPDHLVLCILVKFFGHVPDFPIYSNGTKPGTLHQFARKGSSQIENMIIDLHRTELILDEAIAQVDRAQAQYDRVQKVIIISQDNRVVRRKRG